MRISNFGIIAAGLATSLTARAAQAGYAMDSTFGFGLIVYDMPASVLEERLIKNVASLEDGLQTDGAKLQFTDHDIKYSGAGKTEDSKGHRILMRRASIPWKIDKDKAVLKGAFHDEDLKHGEPLASYIYIDIGYCVGNTKRSYIIVRRTWSLKARVRFPGTLIPLWKQELHESGLLQTDVALMKRLGSDVHYEIFRQKDISDHDVLNYLDSKPDKPTVSG